MNVLAVGAHYDDVELGCSGTLIKHVESGDKVTIIVITNSGYKNPQGDVVRGADIAHQEGLNAVRIIGGELIFLDYETFEVPFDEGLTRTLNQHVVELSIDTVYCHWVNDIHRDHKYAGQATLMASRHVPRCLMYRSNFYLTDQPFKGNFYSDISRVMDRKIEVIKAHKSELERVRYKWIDFFRKQHQNDGQIIGVDFAEVFEVVRYLV